jgi:hypothetical protein
MNCRRVGLCLWMVAALTTSCVDLPDAPDWSSGDAARDAELSDVDARDAGAGDLDAASEIVDVVEPPLDTTPELSDLSDGAGDALPDAEPEDVADLSEPEDLGEAEVDDAVDVSEVDGAELAEVDAEACQEQPCLPSLHPEIPLEDCERLAWDPAGCACVVVPKGYKQPCDDGDACTTEDFCDEDGVCAGAPRLCIDDDLCTTDHLCEPEIGCVFPPVSGPCEDGNPCTIYDQCEEGACTPGSYSPGCGACDPDDDHCEATFGNDDPCDGFLVCEATACVLDEETVVHCLIVDEGPCLENRCDPADGQCKVLPVSDGTPCTDGNTCTSDDACSEGACAGAFDTSVPGCTCEADEDCAPFEDGDLCNGGLICVETQCQIDPASVAPPCDTALNTDCRKMRCEPATGACVLMAELDGSACEDGNACSVEDACSGGVCLQGLMKDCTGASDDCNVGLCLPTDGTCIGYPTNEGGDCAGADLCAIEAVCAQGACLTSAEKDCDDGEVCTGDVCDPASGDCVHELIPNEDPEICDGIDNDCDGQTDEDLTYVDPDSGEPVALGLECVGIGVCGPGAVECAEGGVTTCSTNPDGSAPEASDEVCNELDDDCDGAVDNGLSWLGVPVGEICDGVGACGAGVVECVVETLTPTCSTNAKGSASEAVDEVCNGLDDDCDGSTDEDLSVLDSPCRFEGVCNLGNVDVTCLGEEGWGCDYGAVPGWQADDEVGRCDGKDNDCDGETDEDYPDKDLPCDGDDDDLCEQGTWSCAADGAGYQCWGDVAAVEVCEGEQDEDCDGEIDEQGALGCAPTYRDRDGDGYGPDQSERCLCAPDPENDYTAQVGGDCDDDPDLGAGLNPGAVEICDGQDNDCDGLTDADDVDLQAPPPETPDPLPSPPRGGGPGRGRPAARL